MSLASNRSWKRATLAELTFSPILTCLRWTLTLSLANAMMPRISSSIFFFLQDFMSDSAWSTRSLTVNFDLHVADAIADVVDTIHEILAQALDLLGFGKASSIRGVLPISTKM